MKYTQRAPWQPAFLKPAAILSLLLAFLPWAAPLRAQSPSQDSQLRTVRGTVIDKDENPVASAVIYLKNVRTLTVKTYISTDDGAYHFSGLDPNVDYEIHAESGDRTSNNHTVSSFDNRKEIVVSLKVDKEKKKSGK